MSFIERLRSHLWSLVLMVALAPIIAQAQVDTAWTRRLSGPGSQSDWAYCLVPDGAGGVYVSGNNTLSSSNSDWTTIHYLANGDTAWVRRWTSPGNHDERSNAIVVGPSGDLYLVGYTMLTGSGDYNTMKYSASGDTVWRQQYNSYSTRYDFGSTIVLDDSENVIVSGYSQSVDYTYAYATIKYSRDGEQRWVARACTSGATYPALAVDDSCNVILAGYTRLPGQNDNDAVVIKYHSDGSIAWRRNYNGPGDSTDRANAVAVDNQGNIYAVGYTFGLPDSNDVLVIKYNRQGDTIWTRRYNSPAGRSDQALAVAVDQAGNIYVAGNSTGATSSSDYLLIKYLSNGDTAWTARYNGPANSADNVDAGLVLDIQGGVYVGGGSQGVGTMGDFCVVKYNSQGVQQWVGRYNHRSNASEMARGLGVDELGNVFICGTSYDSTSYYDMATVKFVQAGFVLGNVGTSVLLSPSGTLDSGSVVTPACSTFNYDTLSASYDVRLKIGSSYNQTAHVTSHAPGTACYVTFPSWTAVGRGNFSVTCSTELAGDVQPGNDRVSGSVWLNAHDVGVTAILAPVGEVDSGSSILPAARVRNLGNVDEAFDIAFTIGSEYNRTINRTVQAGAESSFVFPLWTPTTRGNALVACSTRLALDGNRANDRQTRDVRVRVHDVAARAIVVPAESILPGTVVPRATVSNQGTDRESLAVAFRIPLAGYDQTVPLPLGLPPAQDTTLEFPAWEAVSGFYTASCITLLGTDQIPDNDSAGMAFTVITIIPPDTGWTQKTDFPSGPRNKRVKDGCALAYATVADSGLVYALKGNNTCEFYSYNTVTNTWLTRESIPPLGSANKKKTVKRGGTLARVSDEFYATKGNNCLEFWRYAPLAGNSYPWSEMPSVPAGARTIKDGTGAVGLRRGDTSFVYLLKGSSTTEFYRFNATEPGWQTLANAPGGPSNKSYRSGSGLAYDGAGTIFALKGSYNEFYAYDVATNTWRTLAPLPLTGSAGRKKAKDGAGLACHSGIVYCLKGGNTQEFWRYEVDSNRWTEAQPIPIGPSGKRVKGGGALVYAALPHALFATKGSNTLEFWKYGLPAPNAKPGDVNVMGQLHPLDRNLTLVVTPNPWTRSALVSYSLTEPGTVRLSIYDITGKLLTTLANGYHLPGRSTFSIQRRALSSGIYLLRLEAGSRTLTRKLILE